MLNRLRDRFAQLLVVWVLIGLGSRSGAATWRVEEELAGPGRAWPRGGSDFRKPWAVEDAADASGAKVLSGSSARQLDESAWIPNVAKYCHIYGLVDTLCDMRFPILGLAQALVALLGRRDEEPDASGAATRRRSKAFRHRN